MTHPEQVVEKALIIFVKNPEPGKVKTRLARDTGDEMALLIYRHLLDHTRKISTGIPVNRYLFYDQQVHVNDQWPPERFNKSVQKGKDLGERMLNAFKYVLTTNEHVIIIGSDCPDIDTKVIKQAFKKLETHDFVIGPARDGGYYLLGMKYLEPTLFAKKKWSTNTVAKDTLNDIRRLGKECFLLPELTDIDTFEDLSGQLKEMLNIRL